ncbi:MAG: DUF4097 family beta strand repeat protein [Acidobacteriaceae bacterium]|nr:DUF4097 family beta strand repeat protein [Acidobacteriaceae bacterium]
MRNALTIAFTGLLLFQAKAGAEEWNKHWTVGPKPELHIVAGDASVQVEAGEENAIDATVKTHGYSIGPSGVRIVEHQSGNRVDLEIREPSMHFSFGMHSIRVEVRVPRELAAEIHTGDGSIVLHGLHGALRVDTGDGSIQGEDLDGSLTAHSGDGSVHMRGRFDSLELHTQDGSVEVQAFRGSRMSSDWKVETGDGSVHLALPHDLSADVELQTGDGSIHLDLPVTVNGMRSEHELRGKLNGGGPLLRVRTGDGSIAVNSI